MALSTLFELPLDQFGAAAGGADEQELTAAALQQLDLGAAEAGTDAVPTAPPAPSGPTCIACGIGVGGAPGFASAEEQRRHFSLVSAARAHLSHLRADHDATSSSTSCCSTAPPSGCARPPAPQDWHRYNVKRRAAGQRPVNEAAFEALVEDEQAEVCCCSVYLRPAVGP